MMRFFDKIAGMLTWTLADSRDHKLVPGLAISRRANSRWNMRIATRNRGRCERSLKTRGLEIWYGVFDMQTSKYGRGSTLTKSPITTWSLRWAGLHWNKARSETGEIKRRNVIEEKKNGEKMKVRKLNMRIRTFPAPASSLPRPYGDPSQSL